MNRAALTTVLDLALGFGAAAVFMLMYGVALGAAWPHVFGAEWPALGADAARALFRARVIDAVLGAGFGSFLAVAARRGWLRKASASSLMVTSGVVLYAVLNAYGSRSVASTVLESPLPWAVLALIAISLTLRRNGQRARHEV
jgi:hypothetical protein